MRLLGLGCSGIGGVYWGKGTIAGPILLGAGSHCWGNWVYMVGIHSTIPEPPLPPSGPYRFAPDPAQQINAFALAPGMVLDALSMLIG
jgi:hypothetical protein